MLTNLRSIHRLAACAALLVILSPRAQAQRSPATRLSGRVPPAVQAELIAVIDSAVASGLPADALVQKALEGATKRAEPRRILFAVRTLARELSVAKQAIGTDASDADLVAAASALHAGISPDILRRLRRDRPKQPLTIALGLVNELIARGVSAAQATGTVLALMERGVRDEALVAFGREVERDIGSGAPPAIATEIRGDAFARNAAPGRADAETLAGTATAPAPVPRAPRKP